MIRKTALAAALLAASALVAAPALADHHETSEKIVVKTQDDLPRYSYESDLKPSELLVADEATFGAFADRVEADVNTLLADYVIEDKATLRSLIGLRGTIAMLEGRDVSAMRAIYGQRALEEKPDARLLNGLRQEAMILAAEQIGASSGEAYEAAYASQFDALASALPWDVVGTGLKGLKRSARIANPNVYVGFAQSDLDPTFAEAGELSFSNAETVIGLRYALKRWAPVADETAAVLGAQVAARDAMKPDIWGAREVTLTPTDDLTPVNVGIWDSGVDLALFPQMVYVNANPGKNADASGIAYDLEGRLTRGDLYPMTEAQLVTYGEMLSDMKGLSDLQLSIETPEAEAVAARISTLKPEEVQNYYETLSLYSNYVHGTHVAGIAARGNPAIRLAYGRITFEHRWKGLKPTEELARSGAAANVATIDWFKKNNIRVVNMSWGGSPAGWEDALEKHGVGKDADERKAIARKFFQIERDALYNAMKNAPDILFVTSAGNSDSSNSFDESMPSSFELPNMLTVGAVDQAGDETGFTSYGENVQVHADGFQVLSYFPGGTEVRLSGTSMSSPNVTNLAAKLLALDPDLTPGEVIDLIVGTATTTEDGRRHNIHPKAAVAKLQAEG